MEGDSALGEMEEVCQKVLRSRFEMFPSSICDGLMEDSDDQTAEKDRSRAIKTPVYITNDADGEPVLPSITMADSYQAKVVQTALRDYCTAHIRE